MQPLNVEEWSALHYGQAPRPRGEGKEENGEKLKKIGLIFVAALLMIGIGAYTTRGGMKMGGVPTREAVAQSGFGDRPNIIHVFMDDVGLQDYGYGGAPFKTPALDRLAATGIVMDDHYVFPSCSPTRMAFLTGRLPYEFGVTHAGYMTTYELPPETILPELLNSAGYTNLGYGKWHAGRSSHWAQPMNRGFKTWTGFTPGMVTQTTLLNEIPWAFFTLDGLTPADLAGFRKISPAFGLYAWEEDGKIKKVKVDKNTWADDMATDAALKGIDNECNSHVGSPCFISLNFGAAHAPIVEPPVSKAEKKRCAAISKKRAKRGTYCRMMQKIDTSMKRIVKKLKKTGKWKDTIIVITSDNGALPDIGAGNEPYLWDGYGSNLPYRGTKVTVFEGGMKTRAIVNGGYMHKQYCTYTIGKGAACQNPKKLRKIMKKWIKKKGPIRKKGLMGIQDWYATYAAMAGVKQNLVPTAVDGVNMFTFLFANFKSPRSEFSVISGRTKVTKQPRAACIIRDNIKMVWHPASSPFVMKAVKMGWRKTGTLDGYWDVDKEPTVRTPAADEKSPIMMFDLKKDPTEKKNIINDKRYAGKKKILEGRMKELYKIYTADPYHAQAAGIYAAVNEGYTIVPWEDNPKYNTYKGTIADSIRFWAKKIQSTAGKKITGLENKDGASKEKGGGH